MRTHRLHFVLVMVLMATSVAWGQDGLPDSPAPQNNVPQNNAPQPAAPAPTPTPASSPRPTPTIGSTPASDQSQLPAEPVYKDSQAPAEGANTAIQGAGTNSPGSGSDEIMKFVVQVNFVPVPVTVKDTSDHLVEGLVARDFSLFENDVEQKLTFFSSDPFPLSAAVVLDLGMQDMALRKVNETLTALQAAFGPYDEISVYTYGNTVTQREQFTGSDGLTAVLRRMRSQRGQNNGVPVVSGPLASGPSINGHPLDNNRMGTVPTVQRVSRVLNDAILRATTDLSERAPNRRKVLFVISDGMELGSRASYADVTKVLLSRGVTVYGVLVDAGALPVYRDLNKIHLPGFGTGNVLPKYASATGGEVFPAGDQSGVESAYQRMTLEARNQYTLGYYSRAGVSGTYRNIEVRVHRPNLKVLAKDGFYPLPPAPRKETKP